MAGHALTVTVLSYDGRHLLETILPSLAAQRFSDFEVVVVDNGSTDDTKQWLAENWPDIEIVTIPDNAGVTAALNVCLRAGGGSEYLALLNNDLELESAALGELVEALRADPGAGSAGPKLIDFYDRTLIDGAGDVFAWAGTGGRRGHGEIDRGQFDAACDIFGACGGAAVYRRAALDDVGEFDASFFAFYEDTDWAFRAQLAGWRCRYVPTAVVYHMGSATIGRGMSEFTQYHLWRNSLWLIAKGYPGRTLVRQLPRIVYVQSAQLYIAARERRLGLWLRVMRDAARGLPAAVRRRAAVQSRRRVTVRELERAVVSR